MAWTDNLRKASFRGVEFGVDTSSDSGGRRTVTHEFPGRNDPYTEDLGRKARTYAIEGFLVGETVIADAKKLIDALEDDESGELIHPLLGTLQVLCTDYEQSFDKTEGRVVRFSMSFAEEGTRPSPEKQSSPTAAVNDAARGLEDLSDTDFQGDIDMEGVPDSIVEKSTDTVTDVLARIGDVNGIMGSTQTLQGQLETGNISGAAGTIQEIRNKVEKIIYDPIALSQLIKNEVTKAF